MKPAIAMHEPSGDSAYNSEIGYGDGSYGGEPLVEDSQPSDRADHAETETDNQAVASEAHETERS